MSYSSHSIQEKCKNSSSSNSCSTIGEFLNFLDFNILDLGLIVTDIFFLPIQYDCKPGKFIDSTDLYISSSVTISFIHIYNRRLTSPTVPLQPSLRLPHTTSLCPPSSPRGHASHFRPSLAASRTDCHWGKATATLTSTVGGRATDRWSCRLAL